MEQFQSTWAPLLYLAAGILFILALRGLSSPATSRAGNRNGMIGMMIAVGTTIALFWNALDATTWGILAAGALVGGGIGAYIARKIPMTDMPQLVAAFHSLVVWRPFWLQPPRSTHQSASALAASAISPRRP